MHTAVGAVEKLTEIILIRERRVPRATEMPFKSCTLSNVVLFTGIVAICGLLFNHLRSFLSIVFHLADERRDPGRKKTLRERYGEWAVVTGCTDGIGKGYANELAHQGLNVVLISRTESKLRQLQREIEEKYSVRTKYIVAEFAEGEAVFSHIRKELQGINVAILGISDILFFLMLLNTPLNSLSSPAMHSE